MFGEEEGGERAAVGWLVDPLDGTANFLHGFPVVGVSIGLVADGRPVVGVVHAPMLGDTYTAREGGGAFRNGEPIHGEHPRARSRRSARRGSRSARSASSSPEYLPVLRAALLAFEDLRRAGAASLDLAWTAAGVFDGYFELALGPWDVAAGALLVREAGGLVTDWTGDADAWLDERRHRRRTPRSPPPHPRADRRPPRLTYPPPNPPASRHFSHRGGGFPSEPGRAGGGQAGGSQVERPKACEGSTGLRRYATSPPRAV